MNTIDFKQQGGFPFDQNTLDFLQDSILTAAQGAAFGGTLYVLKGCEEVAGNVANGFVVIAGEILPFVGGAVQEKVVIVDQKEELIYEDGEAKPVITKRHATFGDDGVTAILWSDFKRNTSEGVLARLERLERISAPFLPVLDENGTEQRGGMVLWKKPAILIPDGWQEVEDWRGRLPMGYDPTQAEFDTVGEVGGSKERYLSKAQLPDYNIPIPGQKGGDNSDNNNMTAFAGGDKSPGDPAFAFTLNVKSGGSGQAVPILNPYRVVMFIEYIGN